MGVAVGGQVGDKVLSAIPWYICCRLLQEASSPYKSPIASLAQLPENSVPNGTFIATDTDTVETSTTTTTHTGTTHTSTTHTGTTHTSTETPDTTDTKPATAMFYNEYTKGKRERQM